MARWQYQQLAEPVTVPAAAGVPELSWEPEYVPSVAPCLGLSTAAQQAFTASLQTEQPVSQAFEATYPDWIARRHTHPSQIPFSWAGSSVIPLGHLAWWPTYADWVWRTTLPTGAVPTSAGRITPPDHAPNLSWQGSYPDRVVRLTLPAATRPFWGVQPLEPISNPPDLGGGKDVIHLGTKESLGVTSDPTIGGWQPW